MIVNYPPQATTRPSLLRSVLTKACLLVGCGGQPLLCFGASPPNHLSSVKALKLSSTCAPTCSELWIWHMSSLLCPFVRRVVTETKRRKVLIKRMTPPPPPPVVHHFGAPTPSSWRMRSCWLEKGLKRGDHGSSEEPGYCCGLLIKA